MSEIMMSQREGTVFLIASFVLLGAAAAVGFGQTSSTTTRAVMVALLVMIGILQLREFLSTAYSGLQRLPGL